MDKIFGIPLEEIYWNLKIGKSKKQANVFEIRNELTDKIKNPVFFLSTGRSGTKWFSEVMRDSQNVVLHNPAPSFAVQSPLLFKLFKENKLDAQANALIEEIFMAGREQYLRFIYKAQKRYIETNNYITFFAPTLAKLFPDAKFVHLYRHPGEFVRSGIRRGYYTQGNTNDIKRPNPLQYIENRELNQIEKVSWLWNETNLFIEHFKSTCPNRCFSFNFNELNYQQVAGLFDWMGISTKKQKIEKYLGLQINAQQKGNTKLYTEWTSEEKKQLISICNELSEQYKYQL